MSDREGMAAMYWPGTSVAGEGTVRTRAVPDGTVMDDTLTNGALPLLSATALTRVPAAPAPASRVASGFQPPCSDDPELFFAEAPGDVELAKALCGGCPARLACLSGALERREPWGVWGGELFLRGEVLPHKRPRGRPRKAEVAA